MLVSGYTENGAALCRTTTDDGLAWMWASVNMAAPHVRLPMVGGDGSRTAPAGTPANSVNWICSPPLGQGLWKPSPQELLNLAQEASALGTSGGAQNLVPIPPISPGPVAAVGGAGAASA